MLNPYSRRREKGLSAIAILICVFIAGCASDLPPKIETQIIKVPVITPRPCPERLCAPIVYGPLPVFLTDPAHPNWAYLDEEGQARLRDLMTADHGRLEAFMGWAVAP